MLRLAAVILGLNYKHTKAGRLKPIEVTGPRLPALPNTPGIGENTKGYEFTNWFGFLAPVGTPADVITRLNDEFKQIAKLEEDYACLHRLPSSTQCCAIRRDCSDGSSGN